MNAATETKPARPLTPDQRSDLHAYWLACKGSVTLDCEISRPLRLGRPGWRGTPARYKLTDAGVALAEQIDAARREAARIRTAHRGSNAVIG